MENANFRLKEQIAEDRLALPEACRKSVSQCEIDPKLCSIRWVKVAGL